MQINDNKFKIGDIVQKYSKKTQYQTKMICPLCDGKHRVINPCQLDEDDEYIICPACDKDGCIHKDPKIVKILESEIYKVDSIHITITKDRVQYRYGIQSTPELNNRTHIYMSRNVDEDELVLYEPQNNSVKKVAYDIEWDTDDDFDNEEYDLPTEIEIPENLIDEDEISDYVSNFTGFCHKGFKIKEVSRC